MQRVPAPARGAGLRGLAPGALARARAHIETHLSGGLRLSGVSRVAGLSQHHFSRCFARSIGVTFVQYVAQRRIAVAKQALERDPGVDLADLAVRIGFCDQAHLSKVFRRLVGTTPRTYARQCGRQPSDANGARTAQGVGGEAR